jgi:hypothetical protein
VEEMQMITTEVCEPWNAIPEPFNRAWQVDVVQLEESRSEPEIGELFLLIAAYHEQGEETAYGVWRIAFKSVRSYHRRIFEDVPRSFKQLDLDTSMWEIKNSKYISSLRNGKKKSNLHHYVILSYSIVYEIVAVSWQCIPLPDSPIRPFAAYEPKKEE